MTLNKPFTENQQQINIFGSEWSIWVVRSYSTLPCKFKNVYLCNTLVYDNILVKLIVLPDDLVIQSF